MCERGGEGGLDGLRESCGCVRVQKGMNDCCVRAHVALALGRAWLVKAVVNEEMKVLLDGGSRE
jgi:hypothetical protein